MTSAVQRRLVATGVLCRDALRPLGVYALMLCLVTGQIVPAHVLALAPPSDGVDETAMFVAINMAALALQEAVAAGDEDAVARLAESIREQARTARDAGRFDLQEDWVVSTEEGVLLIYRVGDRFFSFLLRDRGDPAANPSAFPSESEAEEQEGLALWRVHAGTGVFVEPRHTRLLWADAQPPQEGPWEQDRQAIETLYGQMRRMPWMQDMMQSLALQLKQPELYGPDLAISDHHRLKVFFTHEYQAGGYLSDLRLATALYVTFAVRFADAPQDMHFEMGLFDEDVRIDMPPSVLALLSETHRNIALLAQASRVDLEAITGEPAEQPREGVPPDALPAGVRWVMEQMARWSREFLEVAEVLHEGDAGYDGGVHLLAMDRAYAQLTGRVQRMADRAERDGVLGRVLEQYLGYLAQVYADLRDATAVFYARNWPQDFAVRGPYGDQIAGSGSLYPRSHRRVWQQAQAAWQRWGARDMQGQGGFGVTLHQADESIRRLRSDLEEESEKLEQASEAYYRHPDMQRARLLEEELRARPSAERRAEIQTEQVVLREGLNPLQRKMSGLRRSSEAMSHRLDQEEGTLNHRLRTMRAARMQSMRNGFEGMLMAQVLSENTQEGSMDLWLRALDKALSDPTAHPGMKHWYLVDLLRESMQERRSVDVPLLRTEAGTMRVAEELSGNNAYRAMLVAAIGKDAARLARRGNLITLGRRLLGAAAVSAALWFGAENADAVRDYFAEKPAASRVAASRTGPTVGTEKPATPAATKPAPPTLANAVASTMSRVALTPEDAEKKAQLEKKRKKILQDLKQIEADKQEAARREQEAQAKLKRHDQIMQAMLPDRPETRIPRAGDLPNFRPKLPGRWKAARDRKEPTPAEGKPIATAPELKKVPAAELPAIPPASRNRLQVADGSFHLGHWIAEGEAGVRLGEGIFSWINPLTGEYGPAPADWARWPLGRGKVEGWVSVSSRGDTVVPLPVPPGKAIASIDTNRDGVEVSVFFDRTNRRWYMEASEDPEMVRIGYRDAQDGELGDYPDLRVDPSIGDSWKASVPPFVLRLLEDARGKSIQEREEVKRKILSSFFYSTNPNLRFTGSTTDNFLQMAFKHYAVECEGFVMLNALISHLLDIPLVLGTGYLDVNGDGVVTSGEGHAWNESPVGIEEPVFHAGGVSRLYYRQNVSREEWRTEMELLQNRAVRAEERLRNADRVASLEAEDETLHEELNALDKDLKDIKPMADDAYYQTLREHFEQRRLLLDVPGMLRTDGGALRLLQQIRAVDIRADAKDRFQLMALDHFLLGLLQEIKERFPAHGPAIDVAKRGVYETSLEVARNKNWSLAEPLAPGEKPVLTLSSHGLFPAQEYLSVREEEYEERSLLGGTLYKDRREVEVEMVAKGHVVPTGQPGIYRVPPPAPGRMPFREQMELDEFGNYHRVKYYAEKRQVAVDPFTGERFELPHRARIIQYQQGLLLVTTVWRREGVLHRGFSLYGAKAGSHQGQVHWSLELHTAANGEWLAVSQDEAGNKRYLGPLAVKAAIENNAYKGDLAAARDADGDGVVGVGSPPKPIVLPDGSWLDRVEYPDGTQGFVGTMALAAGLQGKAYPAVHDPTVLSRDQWMAGVAAPRGTETPVGPAADRILRAAAGREIPYSGITPDGDGYAVVRAANGKQAFVGDLAEKWGMAEQGYHSIRNVFPQGLLWVVHEDGMAELMGPGAPVANTGGLRFDSGPINLQFLPDGSSLGHVRYGDGSVHFIGSLATAQQRGRGYKGIGQLKILPDGRWIAAVEDADGHGVAGPLAEAASSEWIRRIDTGRGRTTVGALRYKAMDSLKLYPDGTWLGIFRDTLGESEVFPMIGHLPNDPNHEPALGEWNRHKPMLLHDGTFLRVGLQDGKVRFSGSAERAVAALDGLFPSMPHGLLVLPDGRWFALLESAGVFEAAGPLAVEAGISGNIHIDASEIKLMWVSPQDGMQLYAFGEIPLTLLGTDRPDVQGAALISYGLPYPPQGWTRDFALMARLRYDIVLDGTEGMPFEPRLDMRWKRVRNLAEAGKGPEAIQELSELIRTMHEMQRHDPLDDKNAMPFRYFDLDASVEVLRDHPEVYAHIAATTLAKLVKFLRGTRHEAFIVDILLATDEAASRSTALLADLTPDWWERVLQEYRDDLSRQLRVDAGAIYLYPADFLPRHLPAVERLNALLSKTHSPAQQEFSQRMAALLARLTALGVDAGPRDQDLDYARLWPVFSQLRVGLPNTPFDAEIRPEDRAHPVYEAIRILRLNSELLKVRYDTPPWDDAWQENYADLKAWKELNGQITEILGEGFRGEVVPRNLWSALWYEFSTDLFGLMSMLGFLYLVLSYASDAMRRRDMLRLQPDARKVIARIWRDNPWFRGERAAWAQQLLADLMPVVGRELSPEELVRKEGMRAGLSAQEKAVFDLVCCVAVEPPGKARGLFLRLFNLIPFASLGLIRDVPQHRARQAMNRALATFARDLHEETSPQVFYEGLSAILARYGTSVEEGAEQAPSFEVMRQRIADAIARVVAVFVEPIATYLRRPDGISIAVPGQGQDFLEFREYVLGDDYRLVDYRRSAKSDKLTVRVPATSVTRGASVLVDLRGVDDAQVRKAWVEEIARSLIAVQDPGRVRGSKISHLHSLLFLMPNGELVEHSGRSIQRYGFAALMQRLQGVYDDAARMAESRRVMAMEPDFYDEEQRARYRQRTKSVAEEAQSLNESLRRTVQRLHLKNQLVFAVGLPQPQRQSIADMLRKLGVAALFWEGDIATTRTQPAGRVRTGEQAMEAVGNAL